MMTADLRHAFKQSLEARRVSVGPCHTSAEDVADLPFARPLRVTCLISGCRVWIGVGRLMRRILAFDPTLLWC